LLFESLLKSQTKKMLKYDTLGRILQHDLGLTPSERSTGESVKRGGITKAGNTRARRLLIEAAWSYRFPPRVSKDMQTRSGASPRTAREIAWKAQMRLCGRFRTLTRKGKRSTIVVNCDRPRAVRVHLGDQPRGRGNGEPVDRGHGPLDL
jgi:Transposase IS116/IS110/IS902 family